jgi:hypothetical protein
MLPSVPMLSADSIVVPTPGWSPVEGHSHAWIHPAGDVLSTHYFDIPPDLPGSLSELTPIRQYYRQMLGDRGGIVELERETLGRFSALRSIVKVRQEPTGMAYVASLTFPFRNCSFVAKVQCPETGMTGMRDTVVGHKLGVTPAGRDWRCADGAAWFRDPYDPAYASAVRRNRSDDEEWDRMFAEHPLSRARAHLRILRRAELSPAALELPPFG